MDHRTEGVLEILVVGLLRDSNNNNNHNIIRMNRDDETLVKSGKFKDCMLSWKIEKNVCKLNARIVWYSCFFLVFPASTLLFVTGYYCGFSGNNDWKIRICVICPRQSVALWM